MHASFLLPAAALFGCLLPATATAQQGIDPQDLRAEIRRIVREEVHAALREMHAGAAQSAPTPVPPMRAPHGSAAQPRHGASSEHVIESLDVQVEEMNDLIEKIEQEVARSEQSVRGTEAKGRRKAAAEAKPHDGDGGVMQLQLDGDGGVGTFVIGGKGDAAGGKAKKLRVRKVGDGAESHGAHALELEEVAGHEGTFQVEMPKSNGKAKAKSGQFEVFLDGTKVQVEGGEGHGASLQPMQPGASSGKAGHQVFYIGDPAQPGSGAHVIQLRAKAAGGEEEEEDEHDEAEAAEHKEAHKAKAPSKKNAAKPEVKGLRVIQFSGGSEPGQNTLQLRVTPVGGEEEEEEEEAEQPKAVHPVAPVKKQAPATPAAPAKARVSRDPMV